MAISRSRVLHCSGCGGTRHSGHIYTGDRWLCGDCVYRLEHWDGRKPLGPVRPQEPQNGPSQRERLFPLPYPEPPKRWRVA
jgi:hypothetical protein